MHPGEINNYEALCEMDKDCQNLYGTGELKNFESDYIDTYVEYNKK